MAFLATSSMPVPSAEATFRGSQCGQAYASTIKEVTAETPRAVRPKNLRDLPGFDTSRFIGLGGISFVYHDFKIARSADERRALTEALQTTCKGSDAWGKVRALFPAPPTTFAETQCSGGAYFKQLFFGPAGIGLDPDRFDAQPQFPSGEPTWSEGYAITALHP